MNRKKSNEIMEEALMDAEKITINHYGIDNLSYHQKQAIVQEIAMKLYESRTQNIGGTRDG